MTRSEFKPGLESLRGLAALIVAINHGQSAMIVPDGAPQAFDWIIARLNPGSAVVIFFVLSGYVLGTSLSADTNYVGYAVRRVLRIIPAFAFSVLFAAIAMWLVRPNMPPAAATAFFQSVFWPAPTWSDVWNNLVFADFRVNGPTWSILPELVGSAFIPVVFMIHARVGKPLQWLVGGLVLAAMVASPYCRYLIYFYAGFFAVPGLVPLVAGRPLARTLILLLGVVMLASFGNGNSSYSLKTIVPPAFGATLLIAAIASTSYYILESAPLRFLGRISYSFYLLHWPIFYVCAIAVLACPGIVPVGFGGNLVIMVLSIGVTIVAAGISYRLIERPFMDASKSFINRREPRAVG